MRKFSINDIHQYLISLEYFIGIFQSEFNNSSFNEMDIRSTFFVDSESVLANYIHEFNVIIIAHYLFVDFIEKYGFPFISDLSDEVLKGEIESAYMKLSLRDGHDPIIVKNSLKRLLYLWTQENNIPYVGHVNLTFIVAFWSIFENAVSTIFDTIYPDKASKKELDSTLGDIKKLEKIFGYTFDDDLKNNLIQDFILKKDYAFTRKLQTLSSLVGDFPIDEILEIYNIRNSIHGRGQQRDGNHEVFEYHIMVDKIQLLINSFKKIIDGINYSGVIEDSFHIKLRS